MSLNVYVGPYLKCVHLADQKYRVQLPDKLRDLIGASTISGCDFVGPNLDVHGIDRQFDFHQAATNAPSSITSIAREMALFASQFGHEIREIRGDYASIEVCWGVVPGWF